MNIDVAAVRKCLKTFDFSTLFREQLGWDRHQAELDIPIGNTTFTLHAVAQKRGFTAFHCETVPDRPIRLRIDHQVTKSSREHFIIYSDKASGRQVWQWVRRESGKPIACREHRFDVQASGEALIQRISEIAVPMDEEEAFTLIQASTKVRKAFDVDKVTKKFYEQFKEEHGAFQQFIEGIDSDHDLQWYTSLMLNRLMFVYFIQRKGFLDGDRHYLRNRMQQVQVLRGKDQFHSFYRFFLVRLFHDGLGRSAAERKLERPLEKLLGVVPYLNGGFFEVHQLEERNKDIDIPDEAFRRLFDFFDQWEWHLDDRAGRNDNEINPDVVGYIFEKYINQKQMGAYYTKEDITEYISKNTIISFLFDAARKKCPIAFKPDSSVWRLVRENPDRYIYAAVRHGVIDDRGNIIPLPRDITAGIKKVEKRESWNRAAADPFGLPTETWREHIARRTRCIELREKLQRGEVHEINDLITLNLDIWQFARDVIVNSEEPELLRAFWQAIQSVTVLDPTCGSGAFLFAALRILETLYSDCLERMERFLESMDVTGREGVSAQQVAEEKASFPAARGNTKAPERYSDFSKVLSQISEHRGQKYFILKSIIINNLFGVDIMEEAVEICKLRLFLKLVAQVESADQIEPLPDIDFNIRAGNTLVGYVTLDEVRKARASESAGRAKQKLLMDDDADAEIRRLEEDALMVQRAFAQFREQQTKHGGKVTSSDKNKLRQRLASLDTELDRYLAAEYGVDLGSKKLATFEQWKATHQPFHWFVDYYGIMSQGGFDVVLGNPPYVATSKVEYLSHSAKSLKFSDLYAHVMYRSLHLTSQWGRFGMIVPLSLMFSEDFGSLRTLLSSTGATWFSSFDNIPAALFAGVSQRCTIWMGDRSTPEVFTTQLYRWRSATRSHLIPNVSYTKFIGSPERLTKGIPRIPNGQLAAWVEKLLHVAQSNRSILSQQRGSAFSLGFSPSARNFVSAFCESPPCLDDTTLKCVDSSDQGALALIRREDVSPAMIAAVGECFFLFWLTWGDGFHVTSGNVSAFVRLLERIPERHFAILTSLGNCLWERRNEALAFKRNARKYVGNFNYRGHAWLTRRADLVLMAGLGLDRSLAQAVFDHVQGVLAINEFAGEKAIPDAVKAKYQPKKIDTTLEKRVLNTADDLICEYFNITRSELDYLMNSDTVFSNTNDRE